MGTPPIPGLYFHLFTEIDHIFYEKTKPLFDLIYENSGGWQFVGVNAKQGESTLLIGIKGGPSEEFIEKLEILVQSDKYCEHGQLGTDARPCGLMVYNSNLQNGRGLLRIVGHSDTALDAQGREVFIYQDIA